MAPETTTNGERGTGRRRLTRTRQPQVRSPAAREEPKSHTRSEMTSSRTTETAHRVSWLLPSTRQEPAYPMSDIGLARGRCAPPSIPRLPAALPGSRPSGGRRLRSSPDAAPMADRRIVRASVRVSAAEFAAWKAKVAAGVPLSDLLRRAMARTRTRTAAAAEVERERTRQVAPHRKQPEPDRPLGQHPRRQGRRLRGDRPTSSPSSTRSGGWPAPETSGPMPEPLRLNR